MYRAIGFAHATAHHELQKAHRTLVRREEGQGTVEYIGLILLIAAVMAVVAGGKGGDAAKNIGDSVVTKVNETIKGISKS